MNLLLSTLHHSVAVRVEDADHHPVFVSDEYVRYFGTGDSVAQIATKSVLLSHTETALHPTEVCLTDGRILEREYIPLLSAGAAIRHLWIYRDVTASRREGDRLRLMEAVALCAKDVVLITEAEPVDPPGPRVVFVNPAFTNMTGYAPKEIIGRTPRLLQGPGTNRDTLRFIREKLSCWEPFTAEVQNYRKDGESFWAELSVQPLARTDGVYTHWIAIQRDITHRKAVEEQLAFQARSLAQVSDAVIGFDRETRVLYWNAAAEQMFGETQLEVMGTRLLARSAFDWIRHTESDFSLWQGLRESDSWRGEVGAVLTSGTSLTVEASVSRLRDADNNAVGFLAVLRDVSERKRMESERQELFRQQRIFVREVLRSVTEGKLELCDTTEELPIPLRHEKTIPLQHSADLCSVRQEVRYLTNSLGFSEERTTDLVYATGESAMNALVHAQGGTVTLYAAHDNSEIQVWVEDEGKGIAPEYLHRATLERGFTTGNSLGYGFKIVLATVDKMYLLTGARGTVVVLCVGRVVKDWLEVKSMGTKLTGGALSKMDN